jgi:hypothetical protein
MKHFYGSICVYNVFAMVKNALLFRILFPLLLATAGIPLYAIAAIKVIEFFKSL